MAKAIAIGTWNGVEVIPFIGQVKQARVQLMPLTLLDQATKVAGTASKAFLADFTITPLKNSEGFLLTNCHATAKCYLAQGRTPTATDFDIYLPPLGEKLVPIRGDWNILSDTALTNVSIRQFLGERSEGQP